jgi:hypothetical protein
LRLRLPGFSIPANDIVGIFDVDAITVERTTRDTLVRAQTDGFLCDCCNGELPRSMVLVCAKTQSARCYLAAPNTVTLRKRIEIQMPNSSCGY